MHSERQQGNKGMRIYQLKPIYLLCTSRLHCIYLIQTTFSNPHSSRGKVNELNHIYLWRYKSVN
jgi:hypothetical protein